MPRELRRVVRIVIAAFMLLALTGPMLETRAASDLYPGAPAVVNSLSTPYASIKAAPDPAAVELVQIDNGISATIVAGPLTGSDGLLWYQIEIAGLSGYIAEVDLAWGAAQPETTPVQEQAPIVVTGIGVVISADGSDIGCRVSPLDGADWIFTYASGSSVDLAGTPTDGWQPVICGNQLGYLPAAIVYDPNNLPVPPAPATEMPTEIVETPVITDVATEIIPEATDTVEVPDATETEVVPEETAVPDVTEAVVEETSTPDIVETVIEETATPEITETVVEQTPVVTETVGSPEPTATEGVETETPILEVTAPMDVIGQTITDGSDLVVSSSIANAATVFNTGKGGLRCRSGASLESPVIVVLALGSSVTFAGAVSDGWQPVVCDGQNGFVASRFLQAASGEEAVVDDGEAVVSPAAALTGASGVVQNTDGSGLRCRSSASLTASVITVLSEGTTVVSRGAAVGVWQPVTCAGVNGWVHTDYIGNTSSGGSNGGSTGSTSGSATVSNTNGDGVRFRAAASYDGSVIAVLMEGTTVSLRSGSSGSWTAISYGGSNGFIFSDYLTTGKNPSPGTGSGSGVGSTSLSPGSNAQVTDTLNFRSAPSYSAGVVGVASVGVVVRITGASSSGFYPVTWGGVAGYMFGDYLTYTTGALSTTGPNGGVGGGTTGGGSGAGSGSGSALGQSMVNYAMRYLGYPYIWATHGPSSFDCSGFTYWVVLNVTGKDIGAGTWTQWGLGSPIQYGNLVPGDLVFFQNTYTTGLSHVGMYIGNDQFIHAENENTGVRISSLTSTYYSTRYLGARRMA